MHGALTKGGWGAAMGYPGIALDPEGGSIMVHVLTSSELPSQWTWLDEFEGPGYERVAVSVRAEEGDVVASLCVLRRP